MRYNIEMNYKLNSIREKLYLQSRTPTFEETTFLLELIEQYRQNNRPVPVGSKGEDDEGMDG